VSVSNLLFVYFFDFINQGWILSLTDNKRLSYNV